MDEPSAKRARVSTPTSTAPLLAFEHDKEFWLDDGSIVLVARNVAFRVLRSILAAHSTVFADMLASSTADEQYEGCPIVRLHDSPEDLRHLLQALFPVSKIFLSYDKTEPSFSGLSALIRLSHKYNIDTILQQALKPLKVFYATNLDQWHAEMDTVDMSESPLCDISVVNLARLTGTSSILPGALFQCCRLRGVDLLQGHVREDGSKELLASADLARCIEGREILALRTMSLAMRVFDHDPSSDACMSPRICARWLRGIRMEILQSNVNASAALVSWKNFINNHGRGENALCFLCIERLLKRDVEEHRNLWMKLPEIFKVEVPTGWGE